MYDKTKLKTHVYEQLHILPQFKCCKYFCLLFHDLDSVKTLKHFHSHIINLQEENKNNCASSFDNMYVTNTAMQLKSAVKYGLLDLEPLNVSHEGQMLCS